MSSSSSSPPSTVLSTPSASSSSSASHSSDVFIAPSSVCVSPSLPPSLPPSGKKRSRAKRGPSSSSPSLTASSPPSFSPSLASSPPPSDLSLSVPSSSSLPLSSPSPLSPPSITLVDRVRFLPFLPASITALAFSHTGDKLAVGRDRGLVELWTVGEGGRFTWEASIPGSASGCSVISLHWGREGEGERGETRLFGCTLEGRIIEWDLSLLVAKRVSESYGGGIWGSRYIDMKKAREIHREMKREEKRKEQAEKEEREKENGANGLIKEEIKGKEEMKEEEADDDEGDSSLPSELLCVACEDGSLRLFDCSSPSSLTYMRAFTKHASRALSVDFSPDGLFLFSSSSDATLKVWEVNSGRNVGRIQVSSTEREGKHDKREGGAGGGGGVRGKKGGRKGSLVRGPGESGVNVWCCRYVPSLNQLVTVSSEGLLQMWDMQYGVLSQTFSVFKGDGVTVEVLETMAPPSSSSSSSSSFSSPPPSAVKRRLSLFAAGTDQQLIEAQWLGKRWVITSAHRPHTHDVLAMAISPVSVNAMKREREREREKEKKGGGGGPSPALQPASGSPPLASSRPPSSSSRSSSSSSSSFSTSPSYPDDRYLVSGGVDTQLTLSHTSHFSSRRPVKISSFPPLPVIHMADKVGEGRPARFLYRRNDRISLYSLGVPSSSYSSFSAQSNAFELGDPSPLVRGYSHLLEVNASPPFVPSPYSPCLLDLLCAAISPNSRHIAYSSADRIKVIRLKEMRRRRRKEKEEIDEDEDEEEEEEGVEVCKSLSVDSFLSPSLSLAFSPDSRLLVAGGLDEIIRVYDCEEERLLLSFPFHPPSFSSSSFSPPFPVCSPTSLLHFIAVSPDQEAIAAADQRGLIRLFSLKTGDQMRGPPAARAPITAISFSPLLSSSASSSSSLFYSLLNSTLFEWDLHTSSFSPFSRHFSLSLPPSLVNRMDRVISLSFDQRRKGLLLLQTHSFMCAIDTKGKTLGKEEKEEKGEGAEGSGGEGAGGPNKRIKGVANKTKKQGGPSASLPSSSSSPSPSSSSPSAPSNVDSLSMANVRFITRYRPLLFGSYYNPLSLSSLSSSSSPTPDTEGAGESHLMVVEVPWMSVLQALQPPIYRKKYGQ